MHVRPVLLVAVLVIGAIGGAAAGVVGAQGADVTLTVSVVTAAGDPVSNAELTVTWDGGSAVETTRSNGQALVDVPEGADVTIEVDHPGYVRNEPFTVTDAAQESVEVTVYRRSSLSLTVIDEAGPVGDVRVVLRKGGAVVDVLSTDARGEVAVADIEAGEYSVNLFEPGYYQQAVPVTVQGETTEELRIERGSVAVSFLVVDDNFDPPQPVAEATVSGGDFSVTTGSDGQREVSLPVNTELSVTVEKEGYDTVERTLVVREQSVQVNVTTRKQDAVRIAVSNERVVVGESVAVTVTDQYDDPIPGASVLLDGEPIGETAVDGQLRVTVESEGDHTLSAQVDQLSSDRLTVTGIQSGDDGSAAPSQPTAPDDADGDGSGFLGVPGVGPLHLRSTAIGAAAGLFLAAVLFLYARLG